MGSIVADIVFNAGRPIVAMPLDVTHKVITDSEIINKIEKYERCSWYIVSNSKFFSKSTK